MSYVDENFGDRLLLVNTVTTAEAYRGVGLKSSFLSPRPNGLDFFPVPLVNTFGIIKSKHKNSLPSVNGV
jgi:hypothetical protein